MNSPIRVRSYAKINWTLDVLFRREDGFHEIRTIYQTISLHDTLHIFESAESIEIECANPSVPCDSSNLVYRAASMLLEAAGRRFGARILIEKRIPVAAGLGGGSSNAGAALIALNRFWGLDLDTTDLIRIAGQIGSDVPFFLFGGSALGVGRGEEVYPLPDIECDNILVANAGVPVSTAGAYGALGRLTRADRDRIIPFTLLAANGIRKLPLEGRNDLEEFVLAAHPEIQTVKGKLTDLGARNALMSGSGGTVFGIFDNLLTSERAMGELRSQSLWCEAVYALGRSEYHSSLFE
jgi:4-diphosphocytidyl-2-C-methyl-D-erythritol kinase